MSSLILRMKFLHMQFIFRKWFNHTISKKKINSYWWSFMKDKNFCHQVYCFWFVLYLVKNIIYQNFLFLLSPVLATPMRHPVDFQDRKNDWNKRDFWSCSTSRKTTLNVIRRRPYSSFYRTFLYNLKYITEKTFNAI